MFSPLNEGGKELQRGFDADTSYCNVSIPSQNRLMDRASKSLYQRTHVPDLRDRLTLFGVGRHFLHEGDEVEQELGVVVGQFQIIAVLPEEEEEPLL